jgi:hydroxypyruvate reductase
MQLDDSASCDAQQARRLLLELLDAALAKIDGRRSVARFMAGYRLPTNARRIAVAAVGKAAAAMAQGAADACIDRISRVLVITKDGHAEGIAQALPQAETIEASHPVPDERSMAAGARLLGWVDALAPDEFPVFLISGGASSLAEHLLPDVTLGDLAALNRRGLAAGWSIGELNAARTKLSALKGGGIARRLRGRAALALFVSDVPGDDPNVIGSGLLGLDAMLPDSIERHVVASLATALEGVQEAAEARGRRAKVRRERFDGPADEVARAFCAALRQSSGEVVAWGGESVVRLPEHPGRGGRNQHLALTAAHLLRTIPAACVLAVGTDGTDGTTSDAGALVDSDTIERIEMAGFDPQLALAQADSGTVLEASGDLVHTGPTGTNVCDLLIGMRYDAARRMPHV